ncbi:hypothetical protein [Desulfitibacter alkalitolerans]|uniref:hypothetical protein n=1 Tax=Desulfitibacter alkalitolerans TaxID=264641 RepID=UPI00047FB061|nr:hypothetical protein [Desulfitibacter alkalitolerans]
MEQSFGVLVLQLLFIGAFGAIMIYVLKAIDQRPIAGLIKILTVVLCALLLIQLLAQAFDWIGSLFEAIDNFTEPFRKLIDRWGR